MGLLSIEEEGPQGDYHKVFKGENYVEWFEKTLLPCLKQPCQIHMDNAGYHKTYHPSLPKPYKMNKKPCHDFLTARGVPFTGKEYVVELRDMVRKWIVTYEKFQCVALAEQKGHKVLWTPPYHSDLQPIELVWAVIKGNVGHQYSTETTLTIVYE